MSESDDGDSPSDVELMKYHAKTLVEELALYKKHKKLPKKIWVSNVGKLAKHVSALKSFGSLLNLSESDYDQIAELLRAFAYSTEALSDRISALRKALGRTHKVRKAKT